MLVSPAAGQLLLALCRRLIVPWHLLLLLLLGSTCGESIGKSLIGAPDIGQCLLPALLRLLGCHPLQQLLLVQHLRRQLALQMYILSVSTHSLSLSSCILRPGFLHSFNSPSILQRYKQHVQGHSQA